MMLSDVCLSVAYIGPKSRTKRPRKTKIGTKVAHVTRDSDTTFEVKRSKVKVTCEAVVYCGSLQSIACYIFLNCEILHYLLPAKRDTELISRLRSTKIFPTVRARTSRLKNSSIRTGQFSAPLVVLTSNV